MVRAFGLSIAILAFFSPLPAAADITRGCNASLSVVVPLKNGSTKLVTLASIEGRGACKNKSKANDCRKAARAQIDKCAAAQWGSRHKNEVPSACKSLLSGSSRNGAKLEWNGILVIDQPNRLTARMARIACCQVRPDGGNLKVSVDGRVVGDKGCASSKIAKDTYQSEFGYPVYNMACSDWREKGICK